MQEIERVLLFQASLLDRREKIQQKHDEAKVLKDGIDRRSRVVTNILQKYFSTEQCDDYDHFIRMKSTLLIDAKEIEESIALIEKQLELLQSPSFVNNQSHFSPASVSVAENFQSSNSITSSTSVQLVDNLQTNHSNTISTTAQSVVIENFFLIQYIFIFSFKDFLKQQLTLFHLSFT